MRGKVIQFQRFQKCSGITPAYAGKSKSSYSNLKRSRDHPRLCGEKGDLKLSNGCINGSPPPMRGKGGFLLRRSLLLGITPAYAGKSKQFNVMLGTRRDHPRLCGEKDQREQPHIVEQGSPPPMRGKVSIRWNLLRYSGITPAYAGKSSRPVPDSVIVKDHPRLCGEKVSD